MLRLLGFLVLVAALLSGVGYWRGWITVQAADSPAGSGVTINLNGEKLREDAEAVGQKLRTLSANVALRVQQRGQIQGNTTILRGSVAHADPSTLAVCLMDGEVIELPTGTDVNVTLGGATSTVAELLPGDRVTVRLMPQGDRGLAVRTVVATRD